MSFQTDSDLNDTVAAQTPSIPWHFRGSLMTHAFGCSLGSWTIQVRFKSSEILRCVNTRSNSLREDLRSHVISLIIISIRFKYCNVIRYCLQLQFTYLLAYLLTYSLTHSLTHLLNYLLTHSLTYLIIYSLTHLFTYLLTYSMEQSSSWEANRFSAIQEIPTNLWYPEVYYRSHKYAPPVPILWQLDPIHNPHPTSWRSILILSSHLHLCLPCGLFPSDFPTQTLCTPVLLLMRATCPAHIILLDFITRTILGEQYRSLSSPLCSPNSIQSYILPHSSHPTASLWSPAG